ncbi:tyrosine-type recombinase/integrase [Caldanaerobacter subterraneus]|uniref:Tyrosine-type recombinase/integrase n=1 Tax=Caldanaerobacter subterraneus TaxID=911092 RepID=A0A7Y2L5Z2_9THEO|nr:tyrosine-type recombinase/integrase [Caldanaerobacter subterraneus]NNG66408.1 tyrosine-type recombinase/integrase [Caldanaerobacter subterraneus]
MISIFNEYILWLQNKGKMESTIKSYIKIIERFKKWYLESYDREFDGKFLPLHIRNYRSYLMTVRKLNAKTINNNLSAIKSYCDFLIDKGIIESNPVLDDYFIDVQDQGVSPAKLENRDFNKLEEAVVHFGTARDIAIFYTLAYTGIRVSELCNIRLNDIVKDELVVYYGKGGKQRKIPLNKTVREAIDNWLEERKKYKYSYLDYLFISERGKMDRSTVYKMIKEFCYIAKIDPIGPHQLRHYFCKRALEKGFTITEVAALAGHSRITTTQIYINPSMQELKEKIERL